MDNFLDQLWAQIVVVIGTGARWLEQCLQPLHVLGPAFTVAVLAAATFALTRLLNRFYRPKRYLQLQAEFQHWYNLRQEALKCEDPEKGRSLAKNIDQATLNQVYYNYFFEGLLRSVVTSYLPFLSMLAFVNEFYRAERLLALFGRDALFRLPISAGAGTPVGSVFWFVVVYLGCHLAGFFVPRLWKRLRRSDGYTHPAQGQTAEG